MKPEEKDAPLEPPTELEFLEGIIETFVRLEDIFLSNSSLKTKMTKMQELMDFCAGAISLRTLELENKNKQTDTKGD